MLPYEMLKHFSKSLWIRASAKCLKCKFKEFRTGAGWHLTVQSVGVSVGPGDARVELALKAGA